MVARALSRQIQTHALECYPREACGLVLDGEIRGRTVDGVYLPVENTHPDPENAFRIAPEVLIEYAGRITAVSHSHPDGGNAPTASDMLSQMTMAVPYIITTTDGTNCTQPFAFGDQLERLPFEGRAFRHAVSDCYELIRDHYWVNFQLFLPFVPRDWQWWTTGLDLYRDHFEPAGFRMLQPDEQPRKHDAFFLSVGSKVPNHGGVYLGNGRILHHLGSVRHGPYSPNHLSVIEYGTRWNALSPTFVRYKEDLS